MNKQLTELQMQTLITFIRMKKVRFYDVQLEIADHFATAIEEKWQENPGLPFEETMIQFYEMADLSVFYTLRQFRMGHGYLLKSVFAFFYCAIIQVSPEHYRDFLKMYAGFPKFS